MKRTFQLLCVLFSAMLLMTACLSSDDSSGTYYDDVSVSSFTLGTLNRYLHTTSSKGGDSIYKSTFNGSNYPLTIDHLNREIYNRDSLPYGTDLKHVVCSLTTRNKGIPYFKSAQSDTLWLYSSSDSLDFSVERQLHIISSDGLHERQYKVRLTAKQLDGTKVIWTETDPLLSPFPLENQAVDWGEKEETNASRWPVAETCTMASWDYQFAQNTTYTLLIGSDADGHVVAWHRTTAADGQNGRWVFITGSDMVEYLLPEGVVYSLVYYDGLAIAFGSNGLAYRSRDLGLSWREATAYQLPDGVSGRVEAAVDASGTLWLHSVATGQVWKAERSN